MTGAIAIVLVLAGLIFFHELGHFLAARLVGVGVRTFSIGFGKPLLRWRGKKTCYQISMIPLGGYVDLVGMQPSDSIDAPFTKQDAYSAHSPAQRLLTVAAGPLFNILLAWFIYWGLMWSGSGLILPEVGRLMPESPAARAGLEPGDLITSIDDNRVTYWEDLLFGVQASQGKALRLSVLRQDQELDFTLTPEPHSATANNGKEQTIYLIGIAASGRYMDISFIQAASLGFREAWSKTLLIIRLVGKMFSSAESLSDNLGGPVMVAQTVHQQATNAGLVGVLKLTALLSINLGLLNLLPIPALDGGHVFFNSIELIFRRSIPERIQATCTNAGFIFLIGLMLLATAMDVFRLAG